MKLYHDYKKQFSVLVLGILLVIPLVFSSAQSVKELNQKIDQKNDEIEKLEKEIRAYQAELNTLGQQKSSLAGSIKELDITRKKLGADISVTQTKIDKVNFQLQNLGKDINTKEESIDNNVNAIMLAIKQTDELESNSLIETMLSEDDFSTIWTDIDNIIAVREKLRDTTLALREVKVQLEDTRDATTIAKNELLSLKSKLADQKKIVDQNTAEKNALLKQTQNSEVNFQKLVASQTAKKIALEQELRNYESQLQFILDPSTLPGGGVLSWPLDSIYVTQLFGQTVAAKRLYASGSHSGVDFRASVGTPVKAMADGVVKGTGDTDLTCNDASFGKWILIEYNNGLSSTYGHLSLIKVGKGQKVSRGEVVGYSGSTGRVTGPHLHVTVYAAGAVEVQTIPSKSCLGRTLTQPLAAINAYLDPMFYLPPYKP